MAPRTAKITLGGEDYTIHAFNVGELERVSDILEGPQRKAGFAILEVAMERAEPKPSVDFKSMEISMDEIAAAVPVIMGLAGMKKPDGNPPGAGALPAN